MNFVVRVITGMVVMAVLDAPMIAFVVQPTIASSAEALLADRVDPIAAVLFYVGYVSTVVFLTGRFAGSVREAAVGGAVLGAFAYATYELTNKAVLKGWPWASVAVDTVWGTVLTAVVAAVAFWVGRRFAN